MTPVIKQPESNTSSHNTLTTYSTMSAVTMVKSLQEVVAFLSVKYGFNATEALACLKIEEPAAPKPRVKRCCAKKQACACGRNLNLWKLVMKELLKAKLPKRWAKEKAKAAKAAEKAKAKAAKAAEKEAAKEAEKAAKKAAKIQKLVAEIQALDATAFTDAEDLEGVELGELHSILKDLKKSNRKSKKDAERAAAKAAKMKERETKRIEKALKAITIHDWKNAAKTAAKSKRELRAAAKNAARAELIAVPDSD